MGLSSSFQLRSNIFVAFPGALAYSGFATVIAISHSLDFGNVNHWFDTC